MQLLAQLLSFVVAAIGVYYIYATAGFSWAQLRALAVTVLGLVVLANLALPVFTALASRQARTRLDHLFKSRPVPPDTIEEVWVASAWSEIVALPGRYAQIQLGTAYLLVVAPAVLFAIYVGEASPVQAVHVTIAGILSATGVVVQNTLHLDRSLAPVRQALLPRQAEHQEMVGGLTIRARLTIVYLTVLVTAVILIGGMGYEALRSVSAGSQIDPVAFLRQAAILGTGIFALGLSLIATVSRSVSQPVGDMIRTMQDIEAGSSTSRATAASSDETAQLTLQLNRLLDQLSRSQQDLEQTVQERTADLSHRTNQLQAAAQVAREAAALPDVDSLLNRTVDLVSNRFGFYHTGIFLLDEQRQFANLQAASSEGGKRMLARGHRLEIGRQGIVGAAAAQNRPHIAMDVSSDRSYFKNPDLPMTRAEAAIPISDRGKVIGVLDIQSTEPSAFSQGDIEIFQTLADQIALAIQNARLVAETQEALRRLEAATAETIRHAWRERTRGTKRAFRYTSAGLGPLQAPKGKRGASENGGKVLNIPITLRGQRIGEIGLRRTGDNEWTETDRSLALEIADQVALALENARLLDDAQRRAAQEQALSELTARLSRSLDPETLLQTAVRELHQLPNVSEVAVYVSPPRAPVADDSESSR
jgi:GAF domain-containing protein